MMKMRPAAKAQKSRTARPEGTEEMTVTIEYEAEERLEVPYEEIIRNVVEEALDYVECPYDAEVNVVLTDNEGIHQINLDMRGIDRPTDVLSFPMCDFETPGDFDGLEETPEEYFNPDTGELMLGDIVISVEKAELSEQQKELFQNAMSGYQEGVYLDISLFKVLNDQSAAITETKKPIRLTISIPEELRKDGRTFVIYREHNGVVELLKDLDNDPATVTIESDQFSVFALAYSDGQAGASSGEAGSSSASGSSGGSSNDKYVPTGDGFPAAVVSAVLLISAALVLVLVKGKRGKASE